MADSYRELEGKDSKQTGGAVKDDGGFAKRGASHIGRGKVRVHEGSSN